MLSTENCEFSLRRGGKLLIVATSMFTLEELIRVWKMALLHARRKKIKKPVMYNIIWSIN